jgi:hypothetical protein
MSSIRCIHHRTLSIAACASPKTQERWYENAYRRRADTISIDMENHCMGPFCERDALSCHNLGRGLLLYPSSFDWHTQRSSRSNSMAEDSFVCVHESRPSTRILAPIAKARRCSAGHLQCLSISSEHLYTEPDLLLVGTNTCLSTCLSAIERDTLDICVETNG